ncbi:hypothetical protein ATANTOWER_026456 [Ataeniobius toweri]|uniref:Uncharacterized protein n=1 Tax=Ataeniobius toweri TaxID=208326 RepID=A0ABU7C3Y9_9TELE|nr:hypothetical protein [Ataeniobius toweri]
MMTEECTPLKEELIHFFAPFEVQEPETVAGLTPGCSSSSLMPQNLRTVGQGLHLNLPFTPVPVLPSEPKDILNHPASQRDHHQHPHDYRPVGLTPFIMKYFEKLVRHHIISCLQPTLDLCSLHTKVIDYLMTP